MSDPKMFETVFRRAFDDRVNGCTHDPKGDHGRAGVRCFFAYGNDALILRLEWLMPIYLAETPRPLWESRSAGVLDFHSSTPHFDGQEVSQAECRFVSPCYLDTGYLLGSELVEVLVRGGSEELEARLAEIWQSRVGR